MKLSKILIFLLIFPFLPGCHADSGHTGYPNILIIYADDMGYGDAQCYNTVSLIPTPNIDRLADEGMLFTDAHSASAVCTPSRYSLLTGNYNWRSSLKKHVLWPWEDPLILKEELTLPEMLKERGYQTAAIGKWHLGWNWPVTNGLHPKSEKGNNVDYSAPIKGGPTEHGFDYYFGDDVPNFPPYTFIENDRVTEIPTVMKPDSVFGDKGMMTESWNLAAVMPVITAKAVQHITEKSKENTPFLLYFSLTAPHTPLVPLDQFIGKSGAGIYGDFVFEVDWFVGQVIQSLEENNVAKNTIVIFTSDNGSPANDGNYGKLGSVSAYGHHANGSFRGYKGDIWEGGHRVPFIVKWPGKIKTGVKNDELICQVDLMKTFADIIGYELPENSAVDSYSILPALLQENNEPIREALVHHSWNGSFSIRKEKFKLIFSEGSGGFRDPGTGKNNETLVPGQFYNMKDDPEELNNLLDQYPEKAEEMAILLKKYIQDGRSAPLKTK